VAGKVSGKSAQRVTYCHSRQTFSQQIAFNEVGRQAIMADRIGIPEIIALKLFRPRDWRLRE